MPKPATFRVPTMRQAAGDNATLVLNIDLARARESALKSIDHAARTAGTLNALQRAVARILGELQTREADLLRFDRDRQARVAATGYADEADGA